MYTYQFLPRTHKEECVKTVSHVGEYEQQALTFLLKTNTDIVIKFSHKGSHFEEDTEQRNIYDVTITNNLHTYSFKFGDSVYDTENSEDDPQNKDFRPNAYSILACLYPMYVENFDEFCDEYGYAKVCEGNYPTYRDKTSEKIYNSCVEEDKNIRKLWTESGLELLCEIQ